MSYLDYLISVFGYPTVVFYDDKDDDDDDDKDKDKDDDKDKDLDDDKKTYTKEEMEKAISRRQRALKEKRRLEEEYSSLKKKMAELPDQEEYAKMKNDFDTLKQQMSDISKRKEEEELAKLNEKEREHIQERKKLEQQIADLSRKIDEYQSKNKDYDEKIKKYEDRVRKYQDLTLESSIMVAARKYNAFNERQVVSLLKNDFKQDDKGDWVYEIYNQRGELADVLDIEERVKTFLQDPQNENLLTASVRRGSATPPGSSSPTGDRGGGGEGEPTNEMYEWANKRNLGITKDSSKEQKAKLIKWYNFYIKGKKPEESK